MEEIYKKDNVQDSQQTSKNDPSQNILSLSVENDSGDGDQTSDTLPSSMQETEDGHTEEDENDEARSTPVVDTINEVNFQRDEETKKSKSSNHSQFCDLCKEGGMKVQSTSVCQICDESYCNNCTNVHKSQKATKDHEIGPVMLKDFLFVCTTCRAGGIKTPAVVSCKECEELYCETCSNAHKRQKATRTHLILVHAGLPERTTCEPCTDIKSTNKNAFHICIDCDEVQCFDCVFVHSKQKATKEHSILCSAQSSDKFCQICILKGTQSLVEIFCRACCISMCRECASLHRSDPQSHDHKVLNVSDNANDSSVGYIQEQMIHRLEIIEKPTKQKSEENKMKPGAPCVVGHEKFNYVNLTWETTEQDTKGIRYELRYKESDTGSDKWIMHPELFSQNSCTLNGLKSGIKYVFQVRLIINEKEGPYSDTSYAYETIQSAAARLIDFMFDVEDTDSEIPLKKLPMRENLKARCPKNKTRKLVIGYDKKTSSKERTVMIVGATGSGKSTLVDGMINYIFGVNWSDPYRLTAMDFEDEEGYRGSNQAMSQTQWVTCYTINPVEGSRLEHTLNVIDTPGFGDTRGIERDKEIVEQIRALFTKEGDAGVVYIDAVCFLVKAPDARLTPTQHYIFNAIMSLFGQDIANNICMLVTFADGKRPPVLSALEEAKLPHDQYFPFNNSGLFAGNKDENDSGFSAMFWNMGCESFKKFFEKLSNIETKSLILTRDVLKQRELIEISVENLLPKLDAGLSKVEGLRSEINILEHYKTQIEANSDFTYFVNETEQKMVDLPIGTHVTNCLNCNLTCHRGCTRSNDEDKRLCMVMDKEGNCTQCSKKCSWQMHKNTPYIFEYVVVRKQKTYTEKLEKYRGAKDEEMTRKKVVDRMQEELSSLEGEILMSMKEINECNNILKDIALRPDPLSVVEHIDLLIESEKSVKRAGFHERIKSLMECRRKATIDQDYQRFSRHLQETKRK